jgi:hypothetical protein
MGQGRKKRRILRVKRTFEPGHLSQTSLIAAYERIAPKYAGVVYSVPVKKGCGESKLQKERVPA